MDPNEDPVIDPVDPAHADPAVADPPGPVDPASPEAKAGEPDAKPLPPKWAIDEITRERAARRAETSAREAAEQQLRDANALLERLQKGEKTPAPAPARADPPQDRYNADVAAAAAKQRMYEDAEQVVAKGQATFKNFNESLNVLTSVGVTNDDFVADLLAVDRANAHVMVDRLAKDPERAVQISRMSPKARIAELTRMAMADQQPKPPAEPAKPALVSRAPPPKPALDPSAANQNDWMSDEASDETFFEGFKRKYKIA